ncbi:MAG: hypothetical protein AAGG02_05850 [Cyanobacteria bacterium P01_H01_bin.15]
MLKSELPNNQTSVSGLNVLWLTWLISTILLLGVGGTLFLKPAISLSYWPWLLAPFNTRVLGAVYLSAAIPLISSLIRPRKDSLYLVLAIFSCFTTYFLLVSIGHIASFSARKSSSIWFFLYGADSFIGLLFCWRSRRRLIRAGEPSRFAKLYQFQALILGFYGLGLLLAAPLFGKQFWPWPLDEFHSHLYSGVFITGALGMGLLSVYSSRFGRLALGITQAFLGFAIALGNWLVDKQVSKLDWASLDPWLWQFVFLTFGGLGAWVVIQELREPVVSEPQG